MTNITAMLCLAGIGIIFAIILGIVIVLCLKTIFKHGANYIERKSKENSKCNKFVEPKPGSEEHYQRWKAENHK